jgi:hypothetical protein
VWRLVSTSGRQVDTQVTVEVACQITPSAGDTSIPEWARECTHTVVLPVWSDVRVNDQLRFGRRAARGDRAATARRLMIQGVVTYDDFGLSFKQAYATEIAAGEG